MNIKSILTTFGLFTLIFSGILAFTSLDQIEKRIGQWFINSSTRLFEWTMPKAAINVEHDRDPNRYNPNEVWISPVGKEWLEQKIQEARMEGKPLEIDNAASLLFKIGTFPRTAFVFLLSLILATPIVWRSKLKALLISILIYLVYFHVFIYFDVMYHIANSRIGVYELEGTTYAIVQFIKRTFCNFGFSLTFAIILWAITCIDFNGLFAQFNAALTGQPVSKPKKISTPSKKGKKKKKT